LVTSAGQADTENIFRSRVQGFDQQIAIDNDDARVERREDIFGLRRLSAACFFTGVRR
jgi:hypothetical protein